MTRQAYPHVVALLALGLAAQVCGYSEEEWRAHSRQALKATDTLSVGSGSVLAITAGEAGLVALAESRSELTWLSTESGLPLCAWPIEKGWNLGVSAISLHGGTLYVLSGSDLCIYRYEEKQQRLAQEPVMDLGPLTLAGELVRTTFAIDDAFVYTLVAAGPTTHIVGVDRATMEQHLIAYAAGRPTALACERNRLYYLSHRSVPNSSPILTIYSCSPEGGARSSGHSMLELPCVRAAGVAVRGGEIFILSSGHDRVIAIGARQAHVRQPR